MYSCITIQRHAHNIILTAKMLNLQQSNVDDYNKRRENIGPILVSFARYGHVRRYLKCHSNTYNGY